MDNLRELVRAVAITDARFLKKPEGKDAVPSSVWVADLITPQGSESWRAIIYAADNKTYEVGFTLSGGAVTLGDDAKEVVRVTSYQKLANSADVVDVLGLENALTLDTDGWALLAPFGEHKKERVISQNGKLVREKFVQVLDEESVDAVIANDKGTNLFQKIKRALVKRPIYRDHPDLKLYAPETVAAGNDKMIPLGVNDGFRRTERGLEFRPLLAPDGAVAVENDGCKYPSALFLLKKTGVIRADGSIEVRPFAVASIGLTPTPNISGVDSLANARANTPAARTENTNTETMKALLIGWLAAQGIALANDATEQTVWDKFLETNRSEASNLTALGNDKSRLSGEVATLTADREKEKKRADEAVTALGNAQTETKAVTKKYITAAVDLVIAQGKLALADRDAKITALENSQALDADLTALDKLPVKFQVGATAGSRKEGAATTKSAHEQILHLANNDDRYKFIKDFGMAMSKILAENPALAEQLKQAPEVVN